MSVDSDLLPVGIEVVQTKRYHILAMLGEGGMGKIYKAFDPIMDRNVALKVMKSGLSEIDQQRFRQEARFGALFLHPNLVRVSDIGVIESRGVWWFAMEYLKGRDLGDVLRRNPPNKLRLVFEIFRQVLDALIYIHQRNTVHCDIKPDNIFVTRDSYDRRLILVKLIDFGVARDLGTWQPPPLARKIIGDPRYMPPEQTYAGAHVDNRADLYALGMALFETMTGRHPFEDLIDHPQAPTMLIQAQRSRLPEPPSVYLPLIPPRQARLIDFVFEKACAKDPEHRFDDAASMQSALIELLGGG